MRFFIVDCFAEQKYQGNQLLVVLAEREIGDGEQQHIAREIGFSETTFLTPDKRENGGYDVRIWTPNVGEMPFAGHPTLGTAYIIHRMLEGGQSRRVLLNLKVGQIPVEIAGDALTMSQNPPQFGPCIERGEIAEIFGLRPEEIREDYPVQWASTGLEAVLIPLGGRDSLARVAVDRERFRAYVARHPRCNCNHLFFVDRGDGSFDARCLMEDFVEDPATGSANGDLAGYLLAHDYFGKPSASYTVRQGEDMGRLSILHVSAAHEGSDWRIEVGGRCALVARGDWD